MRRLLQSATASLLQSATGITKFDNFITKCDDYYKVRQYTMVRLWGFHEKPSKHLTVLSLETPSHVNI